ncbi:hypothetical protein [Duganella sp. FT27W]|uniref:hypothetical protein n=1 Tax=Duganella sp. FT27W TaxID=2654636 RepID=UPI00128B5A8F|nr:hypothetical protein [Duganella sp. FT27W]MPQ55435.1 hypothetical protein [Duganella sp. FT27W]
MTTARNLSKAIGISLLGAFAIPVAGFSALFALMMLLIFLFLDGYRTFGVFLTFAIAAGICYFAIKTLVGIAGKNAAFVRHINATESLALDPDNMLGAPSPAFLAFDQSNRKFAFCDRVSGEYRILDFSHVLRWYYDWGTGTRMDVHIMPNVNAAGLPVTNTGLPYMNVPGTPMPHAGTSHTEYKKNFKLVLETADVKNPIFTFPMQGEAAAQRWCARLNAIFNG